MFLFTATELRYRDTTDQPWRRYTGIPNGIVEVRAHAQDAARLLVRTRWECFEVQFRPAGDLVVVKLTPLCLVCGRTVSSQAPYTGRCAAHTKVQPARAFAPQAAAPLVVTTSRAYFDD